MENKSAIMAIRLAYRSSVWSRIDEVESVLDICTDQDYDVIRNLNDELELLINTIRRIDYA